MAQFATIDKDYIGQLNGISRGAMRKNAIIGGDFSTNPWQRGTSFAAPATGDYTADRWVVGDGSAGAVTVSRLADAPTLSQAGKLITHCLLIDVTTADASVAAGDVFFIRQFIEGYRWLYFAQRTLTLKFWHKHTRVGTYCVSARNSISDRSFVAEYMQVVSDVWEEATIEIAASPSAGTWNYAAGIGLQLSFAVMAGSTYHTTAGAWVSGNFVSTAEQMNALDSTDNNLRFADVRLCLGDCEAQDERRSQAEELVLCQRYFCKSFPIDVAPVQNGGTSGALHFSQVNGASVATSWGWVNFPVRMRAAPTITTYNPSVANAQVRNTTVNADCSGTTVTGHEDGAVFTGTTAAGSAVGNANAVHWTASAEL